ncbi:MAG: FixH family protein [Sphingomonas sp.]|uniref:FixH family protein n=1 Tax=Sphingomonas sp. TaxID=28214 RepID=UPI0025CF90C3|nr:FixH family protein [Sphingomonas sp.]MBX3565429.1 FixH family protein [Sphingomonas sp.]
MIKRFTGWHMLAVMLLMFGTIIAVNAVMATYAISTFGGPVVDNSYVASQRFNGWLAQARAQKALGWTIAVQGSADGRIALRTNAPPGATVTGVAEHPLGRAAAQALRFVGNNGAFRTREPLPAGRWLLRVEIRAGGKTARFASQVRL